MVMGLSNISAKDVINDLSEAQLKEIKILGEEREAANNCKKHCQNEIKKKKITKVDELVNVIEKSKKKKF